VGKTETRASHSWLAAEAPETEIGRTWAATAMAMKTAALLTAPHGENQITETGNQGVRNQNWDGETTELVKKNQNIQQLNQGTRTTQQDTKTDSFIEIQTSLHPKHRGHHPPSLIWLLKWKSSSWFTL
jgi:hypothetical protein